MSLPWFSSQPCSAKTGDLSTKPDAVRAVTSVTALPDHPAAVASSSGRIPSKVPPSRTSRTQHQRVIRYPRASAFWTPSAAANRRSLKCRGRSGETKSFISYPCSLSILSALWSRRAVPLTSAVRQTPVGGLHDGATRSSDGICLTPILYRLLAKTQVKRERRPRLPPIPPSPPGPPA
jgi:hypothetical protein